MNTGFSQEQTLASKSPVKTEVDVKMSKINNQQSSGPEFFGNSSQHQTKFQSNYNAQEINKGKKNAINENAAISTWSKVGGKK